MRFSKVDDDQHGIVPSFKPCLSLGCFLLFGAITPDARTEDGKLLPGMPSGHVMPRAQ